MIPETIRKKINNYIQTHTEYISAKEEAVINIMFKEGVLTKEEIEVIKSGASLFNLQDNGYEKFLSINEIFGGNFSADKNLNTPQERMYEFLTMLAPDIIMSPGVLNTESLTVENIIEKYGKENCIITDIGEEGPGLPRKSIRVTDKKYGSIFFEILNSKEISIRYGNRNCSISNGEVLYYSETVHNNESKINKMYSKEGNLIQELIYNKDSCKQIIYVNNYPYLEIDKKEDTIKNLLVEDLIKDINAKNWVGLPTTRKSIGENILKRITKYNASEVLEEYKIATGNDLIDDIQNEWGLDKNLKKQLINHLEDVSPPEYIGCKLAEDIYSIGNGDIDKHIKMINKDNIQRVLSAYKEEALKKENDFLRIPGTDLYFIDESIRDFMLGGQGNGLIQAICNKAGISKTTKKKYIEFIKNTVIENIETNKYIFADDIKNDIINNSNDYQKLDIDILRFSNRWSAKANSENSMPNGKIDVPFRQNNVGDCWLISALMALSAKPEGRKFLENIITIESKTGDAFVYLKGVDRIYRIKTETLKNSNHLSVGDGDIRAIEIAIDNYLKEIAYSGAAELSNKGKIVDINGNSLSTLFDILIGSSECIDSIDKIQKINFNSPKDCYLTAINPEDKHCFGAEITLDNDSILFTDHAYFILKEDKNYIYVYDPNITFNPQKIDNKNIIKISKENYYKLNPEIRSVNLDIEAFS